ncbi:unnamed protein product, partial [Prorocentrum cordatum]
AASDRWWLRAEMLVVGAAAVAGCSVFFSRPAFCTTEEGLCSTEECACADPAHGLRELRTPDGKECRQCVAACPVANGSEVPAKPPSTRSATKSTCLRSLTSAGQIPNRQLLTRVRWAWALT